MPKGYIVARIIVTNPEQYAEYVEGRHRGDPQIWRPAARARRHVEALEGEARPRNVVIEFEIARAGEAVLSLARIPGGEEASARAPARADIVAVEGV